MPQDDHADEMFIFGYRCNSELSKKNDSYTVECKFDENFSEDINRIKRREDATMKCSKFVDEGTIHPRVSAHH